ncbi:FAD-dependent oxidoreductase [Mesorhizobium sp. M1C.F.Ca.ET.193.01.1.1]|uniref:FAD-dependent monooxygenase n=2 Tax=Mesorhizobium TaxID=68287 RepID=UPI000FD47FEC|nr:MULTISPECIES: FAD-dependent monooxygenase [unclassified Mesorhizobium]TGS95626.1 FAD-dependent oxidoreductase [bacterium M00.F.Ca.ET.177.01.1.1]TGQ51699.1 FAD-dependent oxidoreductase [Mesorhizobium sp. M1C.F.Ca.ET.210.01.1.1]TGQ67934.1 FAD-dependent oxidoreductase [Mesorhizobium sp. M1C.F.Ca.ET.212.01.1.1]TGR03018.1 FAD-dependent oxidoreductase [Mesorhizobium sp. M1C.F.Ca.ET.204.01.1.1]TGR23557.1 FAD-dependent oxidoreductase [Mesorhizobium sp. M1C.F.Ca.ET.196.01.1.1]
MHNRHPSLYDVVISGAGPVGLFLACELRLAGLSVLVLEQAQDPRSPLKRLPFGMRGLSAPTLEALYRRGLLNDVAAPQPAKNGAGARSVAAAAHWMQQARRPAGHFAGIQFYHDDIDTSKWLYRLPSPAGTSLAIEMESLEGVLAARANTMGAEIRRGFGVEEFDQSDNDVTIHAGGETFHGRWLVGCDGGRSMVRKAGGFEFTGTEPEFTGYSVEVEMADPDKLRLGRHYTPTGMYTFSKPGTIAMVEFDGGAFHRSPPLTPEHAQAVLRRVSGTDVTVTALRLGTTWTDRAFQATTYRNGRVLLAGDAAHIHSPLGGQGLNLGLGDAMNLGWKLAATIRGDAPADLLDTYSSERHPVGAQVLDWSRAQVALMRPTRSTRALEAVIRDLIDTRDGATYFAERVWGVSLRYDLDGDHPLIGRSVPDFELADGTKIGDLLRTGKGLLLDFESRASLRALGSRWSGRIAYVAGEAKDRLALSAMLVRPDGFVAWASEGAADHEEIFRAGSRWFGELDAT